MKSFVRMLVLAAVLLPLEGALASIRDLPVDLAREVLSESVPTAFTVFPLHSSEFTPRWGAPPRQEFKCPLLRARSSG